MKKPPKPQVKSQSNHFREKFDQFYKDGFKYIVYAYAALVVAYILLFVIFRKVVCSALDSLGTSFGASFSASFLEDLTVFLILGSVVAFVSTIISTKTPDEHDYPTRLTALFNSERVKGDKHFIAYVNEELKTLLGFNRKAFVKISIDDNTKDANGNNAFKIYTEFEQIITNPLKDAKYEPNPPRVTIASDLKVGENYGYISHLATYRIHDREPIKRYINGTKFMDKDTFERDIDFVIDNDSEIGWKLIYSVWHITENKVDNEKHWYSVSFSRYTQNVEVTLANTNDFDKTVTYDIRLFEYISKKITTLHENLKVEPGNEIEPIYLHNVQPKDKIQFYVH